MPGQRQQLQRCYERVGNIRVRRCRAPHHGHHRRFILQFPPLDFFPLLQQPGGVVGFHIHWRTERARGQDGVIVDAIAEQAADTGDLADPVRAGSVQAIGPFDRGMRVQIVLR